VQLARRLAQPGRHQNRRHLCPRHGFLAHRQQPLAQIGQAGASPQSQRQVDVAELARPLDTHALQAHRNRHIQLAVVEKTGLLRPPDQLPSERSRLQPTSCIQLAKLRHRLLDHPATDSHTAHKTPIAVDFAVLPHCRVAQVHALISTQPRAKENRDGWHYTPIRLSPAIQPFDLA
jgi:hypothetical protein